AASMQRIETLTTEVATRVEDLRTQIASSTAERTQREAENQQLAARLVTLAVEREAAQARSLELHAESEQLRQRLAEIEQEVKHARHEMDAARDRKGELAAAQAKLKSDLSYMSESC